MRTYSRRFQLQMYAEFARGKNAQLLEQYFQDHIKVSQSLEITKLDCRRRGSVQPSAFQEFGAHVSVVLRMANVYGARRAQVGHQRISTTFNALSQRFEYKSHVRPNDEAALIQFRHIFSFTIDVLNVKEM